MHFQARNEFAADPVTTHRMLTDAAFLAQVCAASADLSYRVVAATPEATALDREIASPMAVRGLLGDRLRLRQELRWNPPESAGERTGSAEMTIVGLPARAAVVVELRTGGPGTIVEYAGEFTISVPLIGRSIEAKAVAELTSGFLVQQQVGDEWLTRSPTGGSSASTQNNRPAGSNSQG